MALGNNLKSSEIHKNEDDVNKNDVKNLSEELNTLLEHKDSDEKTAHIKTYLFCVFESGGEQYGIPMDDVKEVVKMPVTTPIPQMPPYFATMANVRGIVYGILDLSNFLQNTSEVPQFDYLLILKDEEFRVGIALENVPNTVKVSEGMIEDISSSTFGSKKEGKYVTGILKQEKEMIILLDPKGMIYSEKFTEVFVTEQTN
jgi:purine-binding chemotaxis protein CheW